MTVAQQAQYLTANGWKRDGELWRDRLTKYLWETSAAVGQQKLRDMDAGIHAAASREASGKDAGISKAKRLANP